MDRPGRGGREQRDVPYAARTLHFRMEKSDQPGKRRKRKNTREKSANCAANRGRRNVAGERGSSSANEDKRAAARDQTLQLIDGFHPKLPLTLTEEGCALIIDLPANVEQCGLRPERASTTIPKHVTCERPMASLPTLIRWWE